MAAFTGRMQRHLGEATRLGSRASGITSDAKSWEIGVSVHGGLDSEGEERFEIVARDITAQDEGTLCPVSGATETGQTWREENLQEHAKRWAGGFVVEPRYVGPILEGACADGLEVSA